ncbi:MAG: hypothetical protein NVS1B2_06330 [Vulcanimicrobiaceae bacterium]
MQVRKREFAREQLARRLAQDSRAVSRAAIGGARATVHHRRCGVERERDQVVRRRTAEVREKSNSARVVFFERIGSGGVGNGDRGAVGRDGANLAMRNMQLEGAKTIRD